MQQSEFLDEQKGKYFLSARGNVLARSGREVMWPHDENSLLHEAMTALGAYAWKPIDEQKVKQLMQKFKSLDPEVKRTPGAVIARARYMQSLERHGLLPQVLGIDNEKTKLKEEKTKLKEEIKEIKLKFEEEKAKQIMVGTLVQARPGEKFINKNGVEFYKAGDTGTVSKIYTHTRSGKERFDIVWSRTGKTTCKYTRSTWMQRFFVLSQQKIEEGTILRALPGNKGETLVGKNGAKHFQAGDTGTVKKFIYAMDFDSDSDSGNGRNVWPAFDIVWNRTGKTTRHGPKSAWMKDFFVVSPTEHKLEELKTKDKVQEQHIRELEKKIVKLTQSNHDEKESKAQTEHKLDELKTKDKVKEHEIRELEKKIVELEQSNHDEKDSKAQSSSNGEDIITTPCAKKRAPVDTPIPHAKFAKTGVVPRPSGPRPSGPL